MKNCLLYLSLFSLVLLTTHLPLSTRGNGHNNKKNKEALKLKEINKAKASGKTTDRKRKKERKWKKQEEKIRKTTKELRTKLLYFSPVKGNPGVIQTSFYRKNK